MQLWKINLSLAGTGLLGELVLDYFLRINGISTVFAPINTIMDERFGFRRRRAAWATGTSLNYELSGKMCINWDYFLA